MRTWLVSFALLSSATGTAAAESCPTVFEEFLGKFEASVDFQRAHTRFPLDYSYVENGPVEPKTIQLKVGRKDVAKFFERFAYPSAKKQAAVPFERHITSPQTDTRLVRLSKPDTDYDLHYLFSKGAGCWELTRMEDWSL